MSTDIFMFKEVRIMSITVKGITTELDVLSIRQPHFEDGVLKDWKGDCALGIVFKLADGRTLIVPISKLDLQGGEFTSIEQVYALSSDKSRAIYVKDGKRSRLVGYGGIIR
jgi:hypothetical protein